MATISLTQYQERFGRVRSAFFAKNNFGEIDVDDVIVDPDQEPREFNEEDMLALGNSIKERGQLVPIRVFWSGKHARWVIIHGERRWRAIQAVGLFRVTCIFLDDEPTENEKISVKLVDQLLREDMPPISVAKAFRRLMELNQWSLSELARKLHIGKANASRVLALLKLPEEIQESIEQGKIAPTTAYEITKAPEHDRVDIARQVVAGNLTRQETTEQIAPEKKTLKTNPKPSRGARRAMRTSNGLTVTVTARRRINDDQVLDALQEMMDAIRAGKRAA
jgi:ParB family transcriptional regulator, chromosome partitioning protein